MSWYRLSVTLVLILMGGKEVEMVPEGIKQLSSTLLKVIEVCRTELGLSGAVLMDLYHLWREEYDQVNSESGCMFSCMSKKLNLLDEESKVHGNAKEYALRNGVDDAIANQLVKLARECEKHYQSMEECQRILETMKCFRRNIKQIQWTADMNTGLTEIIADV